MFCVTAPLLPFDEISLLAGKRFVALFFRVHERDVSSLSNQSTS